MFFTHRSMSSVCFMRVFTNTRQFKSKYFSSEHVLCVLDLLHLSEHLNVTDSEHIERVLKRNILIQIGVRLQKHA